MFSDIHVTAHPFSLAEEGTVDTSKRGPSSSETNEFLSMSLWDKNVLSNAPSKEQYGFPQAPAAHCQGLEMASCMLTSL